MCSIDSRSASFAAFAQDNLAGEMLHICHKGEAFLVVPGKRKKQVAAMSSAD
jgi:hypothetical protein